MRIYWKIDENIALITQIGIEYPQNGKCIYLSLINKKGTKIFFYLSEYMQKAPLLSKVLQ